MSPELPTDLLQHLRDQVQRGRNVLVSGQTASGKTTLLQNLARTIDPEQRIGLMQEQPREIILTQPDVVEFLASTTSPMADLTVLCYRMHLNRMVLDEIRGKEGGTLLHAPVQNASVLATIHAPTPRMAIDKLVIFAMLDKLMFPTQQVAQTAVREFVHTIVHVDRLANDSPQRAVTQVLELRPQPTVADAALLVEGGNVGNHFNLTLEVIYER